jgi:hypothetical protein
MRGVRAEAQERREGFRWSRRETEWVAAVLCRRHDPIGLRRRGGWNLSPRWGSGRGGIGEPGLTPGPIVCRASGAGRRRPDNEPATLGYRLHASTGNATTPCSLLVLRGFAASREISSSHDSIGQRREDRRQTCRPRTPGRAQVWLSHGIRRTLPTEGDVSRSRFVQELGKTEKRSSTSSYNFCGRV